MFPEDNSLTDLTEVFVHGRGEGRRRHPLPDLHFLFVHFGFDLQVLLIFPLTFDLKTCPNVLTLV